MKQSEKQSKTRSGKASYNNMHPFSKPLSLFGAQRDRSPFSQHALGKRQATRFSWQVQSLSQEVMHIDRPTGTGEFPLHLTRMALGCRSKREHLQENPAQWTCRTCRERGQDPLFLCSEETVPPSNKSTSMKISFKPLKRYWLCYCSSSSRQVVQNHRGPDGKGLVTPLHLILNVESARRALLEDQRLCTGSWRDKMWAI